MTAKKAAPAKRGPKPKPEGERVEQLTVRLPPKLKFGLELLARAQGRSLSQAIEWALQVGLNTYRANGETTVGDVVEDAWKSNDPFRRAMTIYRAAPNLLTFEDRSACDLISQCEEVQRSHDYKLLNSVLPKGKNKAEVHERLEEVQKMLAARLEIVYEFASMHWEALRAHAIDLANSGKSLVGLSVFDVLDLPYFSDVDEFAQLMYLTEEAKGNLKGLSNKEFDAWLKQTEAAFPWNATK